ncbi:MAG: glutamate racemase [Bacteroidales bacterium]|nr:glutamate racemase [Bacteroidales bacterium]
MTKIENTRPVGIFDSGLGGLTVVKAIQQALPSENLIYFGDTAHLPYGDKSKETIIQYSTGITDFLIKRDCKVVVIACNSASANAYNEVVNKAGKTVPVINVIDPVVEYITETDSKAVGVIGTKSTIDSNMYTEKIHNKKKGVYVASMATPLFVPMIEEGFIFDDVSNSIIRNYLSRREISSIDSLILGCTHYPIIKNQINKFYNFEVDIIDSGKIVAESLRKLLVEKKIINTATEKGHNKFYVSDITRYFTLIARMFFEEAIELEKLNFWK